MKKLIEIVKVFDLEPISVGEDEEFRFRLEISCDASSNVFSGRVYRLETYRLNPTFPQINGELPDFKHDALIYVVDDAFNLNDARVGSLDEVIKIFQDMLVDKFGNLVVDA